MYYRRFAVMTGFDRSVKSNTNTRDEGKLVVLDSSEVGARAGSAWRFVFASGLVVLDSSKVGAGVGVVQGGSTRWGSPWHVQ
jgi:hypothetical protein